MGVEFLTALHSGNRDPAKGGLYLKKEALFTNSHNSLVGSRHSPLKNTTLQAVGHGYGSWHREWRVGEGEYNSASQLPKSQHKKWCSL